MTEGKKGSEKDLEAEGAAALNALEARGEGDEGDMDVGEILKKMSKAKLIQVLDRGVVNDRLDVKLPPERVGYWVRERQEDIDRMKALGGRFETPKTVLNGKSLHGSEGDRIRVGDVVLMSVPREVADAIADIRRDAKHSLTKRGRKEFLDKKVSGIPHYEER
jgi:hypothetical protein